MIIIIKIISKKPYTDYLSKALLLPKPRYDKENICKRFHFKKANFNFFLLLRKAKYTNFRAVKV